MFNLVYDIYLVVKSQCKGDISIDPCPSSINKSLWRRRVYLSSPVYFNPVHNTINFVIQVLGCIYFDKVKFISEAVNMPHMANHGSYN